MSTYAKTITPADAAVDFLMTMSERACRKKITRSLFPLSIPMRTAGEKMPQANAAAVTLLISAKKRKMPKKKSETKAASK